MAEYGALARSHATNMPGRLHGAIRYRPHLHGAVTSETNLRQQHAPPNDEIWVLGRRPMADGRSPMDDNSAPTDSPEEGHEVGEEDVAGVGAGGVVVRISALAVHQHEVSRGDA